MHLGEKVVKHRKLILIIGALLMIPALLGYAATKINYDMLTYLPSEMDTMKGQEILLDDFGKGGFSVIVTEDMKKEDVSKLADDIKGVDHVDSVVNLQDVIDPNVPSEVYPEAIQENLGNEDASMMVVFFDTSTSDEKTLDAVEEIRKIGTKDTYVSGMSALVLDLKNICETEEPKYIAVAVILSLIAMMFLLDSFLAPVLFLIGIGMAILYNLGSNVMFGEISYITKAIAAVLQLGVTMDYSIFLWHQYTERIDRGLESKQAMSEAVDATLVSVTGSSLTTVAGFLALCFMTFTMGKDLGIVMAKGVVLGVVTSVTILPSLVLVFNKLLKKTRHRSLMPDMTKITKGLTKRYVIYIAIFLILIVPAIYGYNHENVTYDFTKMLATNIDDLTEEQSQYLRANEKLSEEFDIATSYMIMLDADMPSKDGKSMSDEIKDVDGVKSVIGIDAYLGADVPKEMLPDTLTDALIANGHEMMLVNSSYKVSTDEGNDQLTQVKKIVKKYDDSAMVIGEAPAVKDLIDLTSKDFQIVNMISIALVFLIILFVLRSWTLPIILVSVIEFAIYINLGIPGYTGTPLPFIVPVLVSTIQLGSTVDYAILMSTRYKTERMAGADKHNAVGIAAKTSIPSILVSAIGFFVATIGVAFYSNISIISTICAMMARGAIISMFVVILILPSMLLAFDKIICKTTKGLRGIENA